jgi:hypothetical protein
MQRLLIGAIFILTAAPVQAASRFDCTIIMQQQCIEREGDCMKVGKPDSLTIDIDGRKVNECAADCVTYDSEFYKGVLGNIEFLGINKRKIRILGILTPVTGELVIVSPGPSIGSVEFGKCRPVDR